MTTASPRPAVPAAARLRPSDLGALASTGLRTRRLRSALSALGIAIGTGAVVAVLGLAASSEAGLLSEIARLGTNLLTVTSGQAFSGAPAELPVTAPGMIKRLPGVTGVQDIGTVPGVNAYESPLIPAIHSNALTVDAATLGLLSLAGGTTGVILGAAAVTVYARTHAEAAVIPAEAWAGGLAAAILIGAIAGFLPALRAARLSPTQALWSV